MFVLADEQLALLDFGMTGRLTTEMRENLIDIFFAMQRRDYRTIARIYWELAIKPHHINYQAWESDVHELMDTQIAGKPMAGVQISEFLRDLLKRAHRHRVRASPEYTMFFKALLTTEGLAKMLIPEIDPLEEMQPYVERMVRRQGKGPTQNLPRYCGHWNTVMWWHSKKEPLTEWPAIFTYGWSLGSKLG